MKYIPILMILGIMVSTFPLYGQSLRGTTISICDDHAEWPPYSYYERGLSGEKTQKIVGYSVDVVNEIFRKEGIQHTVQMMPWLRCLKNMDRNDNFQMTFSASYNKERSEKYLMSAPYYSTSNYYFYSKKNNPNGLDIKKVEDLKNYRVCGIRGFNYDTYGFPSGTIDQGANNYSALISKLHVNRCSLFPEKFEVMVGFKKIGKNYLSDKNLGWAIVPGLQPTYFHMLISKKSPRNKALKRIIDEGIVNLRKTGKLNLILQKYLR